MGGIDLMDSFINRFRIRRKSRKWTTGLFYHLLDMTVINTWVLGTKINTMKGKSQKDIMKLTDIRNWLAVTLCRYQSRSENKRGKLSTNSRREETPESSKRPMFMSTSSILN
ncbi:chimeric ERCC6-PGBD3 protein [Nephila pilipes]|uniref:Chimeric ERCC6-PGBD3 protein n=1 Tax=Nephila pilipes TaxID=299642 RepID=A0A8X6PDW6_NEPPI|nr:chimeric ERCC6-PGBD3 protein [Nephila pilipes]